MALKCMRGTAPSSDVELFVGIASGSADIDLAVSRALAAVLTILGFKKCPNQDSEGAGMLDILIAFDLGLESRQSPAIFGHYGTYLRETIDWTATLPVPVILTDRGWTALRRDGFDVPEDLVVPLWPATDRPTSCAIVELLQRLPYLKAVWRERMTPTVLRDILVGTLGRDLGIGIGHHDTKAEFGTWVRGLVSRISGGELTRHDRETLASFQKLLAGVQCPDKASAWSAFQCLFQSDLDRYAQAIQGLATALLAAAPSSQNLADAAQTVQEVLPRNSGSRLGIATLLPPRLLLVDDDADDVIVGLQAPVAEAKDSPSSAGRLLNVSALQSTLKIRTLRAEGPTRFTQALSKALVERLRSNDFDFLFLDLDLGDEQEYPAGLELLRVVRDSNTGVRVVVYSSMAALTYQIEALRLGADWFIPKRHPERVPYYLLQLVEQNRQAGVWARIKQRNPDLEIHFWGKGGRDYVRLDQAHGDTRSAFLYYESTRGLRGNRIEARSLTGGLSTAVTAVVSRIDAGGLSTERVIKIDTFASVLSERLRYSRFIAPFIGNDVGRIDADPVVAGHDRAAISYTVAASASFATSGGQRTPPPLEQRLENAATGSDDALREIRAVWRSLLQEILPRLHSVKLDLNGSDQDFPNQFFGESWTASDSMTLRLPPAMRLLLTGGPEDSVAEEKLVDAQGARASDSVQIVGRIQAPSADIDGFSVAFRSADGMLYRAALTGPLAHGICKYSKVRVGTKLRVSGKVERGVDRMFEEVIANPRTGEPLGGDPNNLPRQIFDFMKAYNNAYGGDANERDLGVVHGDLNCANVLVEPGPAPRTWLIDFALSQRDRIVLDFAELEASVVKCLLSSGGQSEENIRFLKEHLYADAPFDEKTFRREPFMLGSDLSTRYALIVELVGGIRQSAKKAGVHRSPYFAAVGWNYFIQLKHAMKGVLQETDQKRQGAAGKRIARQLLGLAGIQRCHEIACRQTTS